ncbi:MAG: diguanylate cyclase [Candidatus Hinthialibacter antarcticus]|nr:diguanylate cyclase [Candidatus Hinthialibacter antarcticus]
MKVIVADDESVSRRMVREWLLRWGYDALEAADGLTAWHEMQSEEPPRMAVVDWLMPDLDGLEFCRKIREREQYQPYTYIILLTGKTCKEDIVRGLEAGADDFISKPFDRDILRARLLVGKRILDLHTRLHHAATHDALTNITNHGAILKLLEQLMARVERVREPISAIMIDLDHFKRVNDEYGHLAGDTVLSEVAKKIQESIRAYDSVGRYGGEEFLVVNPGTTMADAAGLAERIRLRFEKEPIRFDDREITISLSFGVADNQNPFHANVETLIRDADMALYQAKQKGRNRVIRADDR